MENNQGVYVQEVRESIDAVIKVCENRMKLIHN